MITPNIENIIKSLVVKADVMEMGEKIAWGSDTALMRQAAAALQSQAERIKELIDSVNFKHSKITELENERDTLRAQLAEIEATEPVAKLKPCKEGWFIDLDNPPPITGETIELFTRPMPAQDVTELVKDAERWRFTMWWQDQNPRPESIQNCLTDMHRWARARGALGPNSEELQQATDAAITKYKGAK